MTKYFITFIFFMNSYFFVFGLELKIFTTRNIARQIGKTIKEDFYKKYKCKIKFITTYSVSHMMSIIKNNSQYIDMILGVFHENLCDSEIRNEFVDLGTIPRFMKLAHKWNDEKFWPLFYGKLSFVYNSNILKKIPKNFEELINNKNKIILMDPRTSNVGVSFILWLHKLFGVKKSEKLWKRLKPNILTVTKSWSDGYAMFVNNEAPIVLSYTTSPAYHRIKLKQDYIKTLIFKEGHYLHYSIVGILKKSKNKKLLKNLIMMLLSKNYQKKFLFESEWNFPIREIDVDLPLEFNLDTKDLKPYNPKDYFKIKNILIQSYLKGLA